jgi:hypothetical protein
VAWKFAFIDNPCRHALGKHDQRIAGLESPLFNRMDCAIERALEPATATEPKDPLQIMDYADLLGGSREQTHHNQKEQGWGKYCNGDGTAVSHAPRCPARVPREPGLKDQSPQDHGARISHPSPAPMDGNILEPVSRSDRFPCGIKRVRAHNRDIYATVYERLHEHAVVFASGDSVWIKEGR